jgi:hypothetical protein
MTETRIRANCNSASPRPAPSATNLQFSNRQLPLLESRLNDRKQTMAIVSNRNFLRGWSF